VEKLAAESVNFTEEGENILFIVSNLSPVNEEKYTELFTFIVINMHMIDKKLARIDCIIYN